jgi:pyrroloquinoline quinone (PQQ) biosynthesis protein C
MAESRADFEKRMKESEREQAESRAEFHKRMKESER